MPYIHHAPPMVKLLVPDGPQKMALYAEVPLIHRCDMQSLVDAFPCLRAKDMVWLPSEDARPFKRRRRERCCSHGEYIAATFCLHVWNRHDNRFNFGEAVATLDEQNLAAIQAWLLHPWFM